MKKNNINTQIVTCLLLGLILAGPVAGQVPQMMSYQGRVTSGGEAVNGTGYFKFALVDSTGNQIYWSHDGPESSIDPGSSVAVNVSNGLFTVMLGEDGMEPVNDSVFSHNDVYLRVWFSEDNVTFTLLTPDHPIGSVGYAAMAAQVSNGAIGEDQLASLSVTSTRIANGAVTATKLAAGSVTADKIVTGTITSNKLDWSTMPAIPAPLSGYAENGAFSASPVASGANSIAMGHGALAAGDYAMVGGGATNRASGNFSSVSGGLNNTAGGVLGSMFCVVGGGWTNTASGFAATVGGGMNNFAYTAVGSSPTIGGGRLTEPRRKALR